jgi:hypothetical protein
MIKPLTSYFLTAPAVPFVSNITSPQSKFVMKGTAATALFTLTGCSNAATNIAVCGVMIGIGIWGIADHVFSQRELLHSRIGKHIENENWDAIKSMLNNAGSKRKVGAIQRALMHKDHRDRLPLDTLAAVIDAEGNSLKPCAAAYLLIFRDCADKWAKGDPKFADSLCEFTDQSPNKLKWIRLEHQRWELCAKDNVEYNLPLAGHLLSLGIFLAEEFGRAEERMQVPPRLCADEPELLD